MLVRRQQGKALPGGQLDIDAHPVRQHGQLRQQLPAGAGDGLGVDIAEKMIFLPQDPQGLQHQLTGVVRALHHRAGQKQTLDIISPVKLDRQLRQLPGRKGGAPCIVGAAVDAVGAVVAAGIALQDLQQRDAPPVGRKAVAAAAGHGSAQPARPGGPVQPAGGAGGVVFCGVGQNGQLVQNFHRIPSK